MRSCAVIALALFLMLAPAASAQQPDVLKAAADALGAASLKTLQINGWGWGANFLGQNFTPNDPWPRINVPTFTALINYDTASMRVDMVRQVGAVMALGGGNLISGEQRSIQVVSGSEAWNVPTEGPAAGGTPQAQPQPDAAPERMLALWATPHGFVKAAMANRATTRNVPGGTEVSFTVGGKYKMSGLINAQNQIERVRTWIDQPLMGDLLVETIYRVYRNIDGMFFPSFIAQSQGGFPVLELTITSVHANPAADITVPANVRGAQPTPPVRVTSKALADGVYFFSGGGPNSLAVEMRDHIVLIEAPFNEARVLALIAKAKELIPNKPIRFVVNTHHHWDHSGGIRAAMDEGATIVTHESNRPFFEKVAQMPHTLAPDRLSVSRKAPKLQTVGDSGQLTDGNRTLNLYVVPGFVHAAGMLMVYLPNEKILVQADAPGRPDGPPGTRMRQVRVAAASALYDDILRRKLDVRTIVMMHSDEQMTMAEFTRALGRGGATSAN